MFGLNTYMLIGIAVIMGMMGIYFAYSQHEMKVLNQTIATQKVALQTQALVITQLKKDADDIRAANKKLADTVSAQDAQRKKLENTLSKLQSIPTKKATLLQDLINKASAARVRCLAIASGASPLVGEVNRVCPELMQPVKKEK